MCVPSHNRRSGGVQREKKKKKKKWGRGRRAAAGVGAALRRGCCARPNPHRPLPVSPSRSAMPGNIAWSMVPSSQVAFIATMASANALDAGALRKHWKPPLSMPPQPSPPSSVPVYGYALRL